MDEGGEHKRLVHSSSFITMLRKFFRKAKPLDRRQNMRCGFNIPLECRCFYSLWGKKIEHPSFIVDVARGGMLLMTGAGKIEPGTKVEVVFKGVSSDKDISITGKVIRTYRQHAEKWYFSGVRFEDTKQQGIAFLLLSSSQPV